MLYFIVAVLSSFFTLLVMYGIRFIKFKRNKGTFNKLYKYYFYIEKNKIYVDDDRYSSIKTEEMIKSVLKIFNQAQVDMNTVNYEYRKLWDRLVVKAKVTKEQLLALKILLNSDSYFYLVKADKYDY